MQLLKTAATLAVLATSVVGSPVNNPSKTFGPVASTDRHLKTTSVSQINVLDVPDQRKAFGEGFLKAVRTFIFTSPEVEFPEGTDIMSAPLIQPINATINSILNPISINSTGLYKNDIDVKLTPRGGNPAAWELSGGARKPPCPGWPVRQKYNSTHWREWTFFHGYIYGPLNPRCDLSSGHP